MYLYFDRSGTLKEVVNDLPLRQGSSDVNHIYVYMEQLDTHSNQNFWVQFRLHDGTLIPNSGMAEIQFNPIGSTTGNFPQLMQIPFDDKRDLKFFKYYEDYPFYEIPLEYEIDDVPTNVLGQYGDVALSINVSDFELGLIIFNVQRGSYGTSEIQYDEYITLAQFTYLRDLINSRATVSYIDAGLATKRNLVEPSTIRRLVYIVDTEGNQISVGLTDPNEADAGSIPVYNGHDCLVSEDPQTNKEVVNKEYAEDNFVNQLNTAGVYVYSHNGGTDGEIKVSVNTTANSIALRDENGNLKSNNPQEDEDVVNKQYLSNAIAEAISGVYHIAGTKTVAQINSLPLSPEMAGNVYNLSDSGTITLGDLEVSAGDNIVLTYDNGTYAWDKFSSTIDLSIYMTIAAFNTAIADYYTKQETYNKTEVDTALALKADKNGRLPSYSVASTDVVSTFIANNNVKDKAIILYIDGIPYIGCFKEVYQANLFSWELERIAGPTQSRDLAADRYVGQNMFASFTTTQFSVLLTDTYYQPYQLRKNKVDAFQATPDNDHYPSEKLVYDSLQDVREIAEGKCKTFTLSYADTMAIIKADLQEYSSHKMFLVDSTHGYTNPLDITDDVKNTTDYDDITIVNSIFNSNNNVISNGDADEYLIVRTLKIVGDADEVYSKTYLIQMFTGAFSLGDILLVIETNVPDRWYGGSETGTSYFYKLEIDLSNYVDLTNAQTITGQKTFEENILLNNKRVSFTTNLSHSIGYYSANYLSIGTPNFALLVGNKEFKSATNGDSDLGTSSYNWKDLYLSGSIKINNVNSNVWSVDNNNYNQLLIRYNSTPYYYFSSTSFMTPSIYPSSNNAKDLGSTTYKWRDLYLAGLLKMANSQVKDFIKLTQTQYDALVSDDEVDADTFYFIEEE